MRRAARSTLVLVLEVWSQREFVFELQMPLKRMRRVSSSSFPKPFNNVARWPAGV